MTRLRPASVSPHANTDPVSSAAPISAASSFRRERTIVLLVAAVQFVNILDFMMVMPLGPDFANSLDIPMAHIGYLGGAYTVAAAMSGIAGSFFLDRFDRRKALAVTILGLVAA